MSQSDPVDRSISLGAKIAVSVLFAALYASFLIETGVLAMEYSETGLAMRLATLDAQNFIFFPIAGLLALIGFWRPTVLLVDAFARNTVKGGRAILVLVIAAIAGATWGFSLLLADGTTRSLYEVSPVAIQADGSDPVAGTPATRQPVADVLTSLKIMALGPEGLTPHKARCDREWLQFSPAANEEKFCVPAGAQLTVADCCKVKTAFRAHVNDLAEANPSMTAQVHRWVLPVKVFFLLLLFAVGVLLVRFRKTLAVIHGDRLHDMSFGMALGGLVMLCWPMLNAAYLETTTLLTGDGSAGAYAVMAPLIALAFGIWALLLIFFHLRSYPSQLEYAARLGGFAAAAIGVLRYEEITGFLISNLGIGGGIVAIVVFAVAVLALIAAVVSGVSPKDFDFDKST
ncbi:MAG: hypothetical protein AAFX86_14160 [Pseudomonadota bacterium]